MKTKDLLEIESAILRNGSYSMSLKAVNKYWANAAELVKWMTGFGVSYRKCWRGENGVEFYIS